MAEWLRRMQWFFDHGLWEMDPAALGRPAAFGVHLLRMACVLGRDLAGGQLTLRAMSLVYTTLLSLVPLLAVSFSVLKAFGVHNQVEPLLGGVFAPLGPMGDELTGHILNFVENVRVGVLGSMGLALLLYTTVSLIQKIESAFNFVWHIKRSRTLSRRFSDYLSVILVGPVLVFAALGLTASITSTALVQKIVAIEPFGSLFVLAGKVVPYLFIIAAFTFIYIFVPNTRVRLGPALTGAVIGGVLWEGTGVLFASFAAGSTRYAAIYSGFAILILFMIWLYLSWLILLFGAQVAYYRQYPQRIRQVMGSFCLSGRLKERVGLLIMWLVAERHVHGGAPWTLDALVRRLQLPGDTVEELLAALEGHGFLAETADDPPALLLAHDPEGIHPEAVLAALRSVEEKDYTVDEGALAVPEVDGVLSRFAEGGRTALADVNLKTMVKRGAD